MSQASQETITPQSPLDESFFGHPRALSTLFFTEMWERFSYYGMRALLILFMTAPVAAGGLGFGVAEAGALYGLYTAGVYLLALPGGWIADRLWGQQRAVLVGGVLIAAGHFTLAVSGLLTFYAGLALIILGTGLLKPNISTIVGELYAPEDKRRDAGFAIFYMGINVGGFLAPLICGYLGEEVGWHWGFGAAGVGMVLGLIQYSMGRGRLGDAGALRPESAAPAAQRGQIYLAMGGGLLLTVFVTAALAFQWLPWSLVQLANAAAVAIGAAAALFFAYVLSAGGLETEERRRVSVIAVLFIFSTIFWAGFEQGGSSLSIFARDMTDRVVGGWEFPASWFQFVNSAFVIAMVPVFAVLWVRLGKRQPSIPVKFGLGLILMGAGFGVLAIAAGLAAEGTRVGLGWLVAAYFLHTCGELCLSPVGLSTVTQLAPQRLGGQMMGVWFISISLGNILAGLVAGQIANLEMSQVFLSVFLVSGLAGIVVMALKGPLKARIGGVGG